MSRTVSIGCQDFETIQKEGYFYIDKTDFIREWWERGDSVTLITRPRRFGKTLTLSMVEKFFSLEYADRGSLFQGLKIWEKEKYRELQGTYPVVFLSFADVKEPSFEHARKIICRIIKMLYSRYEFLLETDVLTESEKEDFSKISADMDKDEAAFSLKALCSYLFRYYDKKVILLLDEYDTPMQEAYVHGYWDEMVSFTRSLFNAAFKTNPYLDRAIMTGITRVSKESMFSDLNNLEVAAITAKAYADSFGFTEEEVFAALNEFGLGDRKEEVKQWYDGFNFGERRDIYNPWSIINYLDKGKLALYWVNTSSNSLAGKLIQEGSPEIKMTMEGLLEGGSFHILMDEQIAFHMLEYEDEAVWSLLYASGYLTAERAEFNPEAGKIEAQLRLTNREVRFMFLHLIQGWFGRSRRVNNAFLQALLEDDVKAMNIFMNKVALQTFSYFDTGKNPSEEEPERFYHGFVLGMMVELRDRYIITSNRESGFGRYDVMLEPVEGKEEDDAIIIEFKVQEPEDEPELADTVKEALNQIHRKKYQAALEARGIPRERIRKYGFAFCGKRVLIGRGENPGGAGTVRSLE